MREPGFPEATTASPPGTAPAEDTLLAWRCPGAPRSPPCVRPAWEGPPHLIRCCRLAAGRTHGEARRSGGTRQDGLSVCGLGRVTGVSRPGPTFSVADVSASQGGWGFGPCVAVT